MLNISVSIVDCRPYSEETFAEDGFEESGLRTWLNEVILFDMFDTKERAAVEGGAFCLDAAQAESLIEDDADRIAFPTAYAALRAYGDECGNAACWWLADPGGPDCAQFVRHDGQVYPFGMNAEYNYGVRPALWVKYADACWREHPDA